MANAPEHRIGHLNGGYLYRETIGPEAAGATVLQHLAQQHPHSTTEEWSSRLSGGQVELDGASARAESPLRAGQELIWHRPAWVEEDVPVEFEVLFEDEHLLAVNKPSGLPTLPGGGFLESTLLAQVKQRDPSWDPMHRLGRGTSGIVLFARGDVARRAIQEAMRGRTLEKLYLALASGRVTAPQTLLTPIGQVPHPTLGWLHAASASGKPSESRVLRSEPRGDDSRVEILLITGRPHQIRIHLAACGHPLVGDPLYRSGGAFEPNARPGEVGYQLHAWRLGVVHPRDGRRLELVAPPPPSLAPL